MEGLNEKATSSTWLLKSCRGGTARLLISSGEEASHGSIGVECSHVISSFGMTILETASNILVPDQ